MKAQNEPSSYFVSIGVNSWIVVLLAEEQSTSDKASKRTYAEEYELFIKRYGLEWRSEKNLKWLPLAEASLLPNLKRVCENSTSHSPQAFSLGTSAPE